MFIAIGRHIDNPLVLLVQDSIGAYFFRPVVMFAWWATAAVLGEAAPAHLAFNVAWHAGNGLLLFALLRTTGVSAAPAGIAAVGFIAHPSAFSAAAWLSDRFDLFATAFGLAALIAVERYLEAPRRALAAWAAIATLAALFSKEIGFALAGLALLAILWPDRERHAAGARARMRLFGLIAGCMLVALAVRPLVLRPGPQETFFESGVLATVLGGLWTWIRELPGFLVVVHGNVLGVTAWILGLIGLVAAVLLPRARSAFFAGGLARIAGCGLALMLAAALAQAPVLNSLQLAGYTLEAFDYGSLAGSRLYYVPLAGFALIAGAAGEAIVRAGLPRPAKLAAVVLTACALVGLVATSRSIGREWATYARVRSDDFARAALAAIAARRDLAPGCKIYLLETPALAANFRDTADTAVKQALPRRHPALGCFIQAEHAPWYHLVATGALPPDAEKPLETIQVRGRAFEPLALSNLSYYYLRIPDTPAVLDDPRAIFLVFRDGVFTDATAEVRARRRAVRFYDTR